MEMGLRHFENSFGFNCPTAWKTAVKMRALDGRVRWLMKRFVGSGFFVGDGDGGREGVAGVLRGEEERISLIALLLLWTKGRSFWEIIQVWACGMMGWGRRVHLMLGRIWRGVILICGWGFWLSWRRQMELLMELDITIRFEIFGGLELFLPWPQVRTNVFAVIYLCKISNPTAIQI